MSFHILEPTTRESPLIVEVPHAGLQLDPLVLATLSASARSVGMDADLYVDELYCDAPSLGATMIVAEMSRYVCDLNRAETDVDAGAVVSAGNRSSGAPTAVPAFPHGLIWRLTTEGRAALAQPLVQSEYERRLNAYYRPYHTALTELTQRKLAAFGYVVVLAAHSMPSAGRAGHLDTGARRADIVPGSRGRTSAAASVIECPERIALARGLSVEHDQPYRGGFTTGWYGRPATGVHVVQVEINRALYMNESTLEPIEPGFAATKGFCTDLVQALTSLPAALLLPPR